ncbi:hypothetical protein P43SY_003912 [Pythium insidiosum]|uniref:Cyclin-like domain-containing protein n=1 Tax=Pythium insidiosum TaxID=114742 RepID=A0AAD5LMH1_PYTIN|nr:hypothetical protein P43SY_003912 [Pythium insidiosum]
MSYLQNSTHYNNWIFRDSDLERIARLRQLKARKALRLERAQAADGAAPPSTTRKARSFAALLPESSTATRDENDWNDDIDGDLEQLEQQEAAAASGLDPPLEALTPEQERLVCQFYEDQILESCNQFFRTSDKVKCCAVMLFKRFYLSNSVMEFHPKYLAPTAIYVAGKVEEQYTHVDKIAEQLQIDHKHIVGHEMVLLEGVRFQLIMYHPFRALLGFVDDFRGFRKAQSRELPLDVLQRLHANACMAVNEMMLTDLPLTSFPAFLALAALCHVADEIASDGAGLQKSDVLEYVARSRFAQGQDLAQVTTRVEQILKKFAKFKDKQKKRATDPAEAEKHTKKVKKLYKKLKTFHPEDAEGKKRKANGDARGEKQDDKKKAKKAKKDKK